MSNNDKLRVFLCYSSLDRAPVRFIYDRLAKETWIEPWMDEKKLLGGQDWKLEIAKAVQDADKVVVFLSKESVEREGYVWRELRKILDKVNEKPEGTNFVIPVRLNNCIVPKSLQDWYWIDYFPSESRSRAYSSLVKRLSPDYSTIEVQSPQIEITTEAKPPFADTEELLRDIINQLERSKRKKIFISYARDDYKIASEIYHFLKENGFSPWLDKFDLVPGQNWELEIHRSIKSCDFFIACLSQNSVSKRGYVQKELKQALSMLEQFPEGEIYLIPIRIDDCMVPKSLSKRQWLDWSNKNAKQHLLRAIIRN